MNNDNPVDIAKKLEDDANTKLNSFSLFYRKERNLAAADIFKRAANMYNINKKYKEFLRCMIFAAKIYEENDNKNEASICYLESARIAKYIDEEQVEHLFSKYMELCNNTRYGEIYKEIGEFFKSLGKYDDAIKYLTYAISDFNLHGRTYSINTCLDNICRIYINTNNFKDAGETLIKMSNNIKISKENLIFTGILCFINYDLTYAKDVLSTKYDVLKDDDISFLDKCISYIMNKDLDKLNDILDNFNFKFKVKAEHMNAVKNLKKIITQNSTNEIGDDIDLT